MTRDYDDPRRRGRHDSMSGDPDSAAPSGNWPGRRARTDSLPLRRSLDGAGGQPLPTPLADRLGAALGADVSPVRIHTGADSAQAARELGANAWAVGRDVHFAAGIYDPSSPAGQHLIAHEVAHTVQQGPVASPQFDLEVSEPGDAHEVEADRFADSFVAGGGVPVTPVGRATVSRAVIQRQEDRPEGGVQSDPAVSPSENLDDLLHQIAVLYGDILEKQEMGVDKLERALGTPDTPSLTDQLLAEAVSLALTAATGAIGVMVANAVQGMVQRRLVAGATAALSGPSSASGLPGVMVEPTVDEAAITERAERAARLARYAAEAMKDMVKTKLKDMVVQPAGRGVARALRATTGVLGMSAVDQFVQAQRHALINTKVLVQQEFLGRRAAAFRRDPNGGVAAGALHDALLAQFDRASDEQFLASLREWSVITRRKEEGIFHPNAGIFEVHLDMPTPQSPVKASHARWPSINETTRNVLRLNYADHELRALDPPFLRIVFTGQTEEFALFHRRGMTEVMRPESGHGWYFLHEVSNHWAKMNHDPHRTPGGDMRVQAAAHIVWAEVLRMKMGALGEITD